MRWLPITLLLAACGPPEHYTVTTQGLTIDQQDQVATAMVAWTSACPGLTLDLSESCNGACIRVEIVNSLSPGLMGLTYPHESDGTARITLLPNVTQQTVTHEMGHALGLAHLGPGTIMCKDDTCASQVIMPADVAAFDAR
jgi:hypothetical protein